MADIKIVGAKGLDCDKPKDRDCDKHKDRDCDCRVDHKTLGGRGTKKHPFEIIAPVMNVVYRPGDPEGPRANVYTVWEEAYEALQSIHGRGVVTLEFDNTYVNPCPVPAGVWNMDNVIWTNTIKDFTPDGAGIVIVELADGCSIVLDPVRSLGSMKFIGTGLGIISNRKGPVAPFVGINLIFDGPKVSMWNTDPLALPMIVNVDNYIIITGAGDRSAIGDIGVDPPAPVVDVNGGFLLFVAGAGTILDGAVTDNSVAGGGFFLVLLPDDAGLGTDFGDGDSLTFPALIANGGIVSTRVNARTRALVQVPDASPFDANYNSLILVDTSGGPVTVNAPPANPLAGEFLRVKDFSGNAGANPITIAPRVGDVVESPTITTNFQCKTWISDGSGNWVAVSST